MRGVRREAERDRQSDKEGERVNTECAEFRRAYFIQKRLELGVISPVDALGAGLHHSDFSEPDLN